MLSNLAECAAMCRTQRLFDVLDHGGLLVERSAGDDESFRASQLLDYI
jgi:hypothetical protein